MKSYQPSGIHLAESIELFARMIDGRINTNKHKKRARHRDFFIVGAESGMTRSFCGHIFWSAGH